MNKTAALEILLQMEDEVRNFNINRELDPKRSKFFRSIWLVDERGRFLPSFGSDEAKLTSRLKFPVDYRMILGRETSYGTGHKIQTHVEVYSFVGKLVSGAEAKLCFMRISQGFNWTNQSNEWIARSDSRRAFPSGYR